VSKKSQDPPKKNGEPQGKQKQTRRAILASLGIGMALPALRASGQTAKSVPSRTQDQYDEAFDEYWDKVEDLIKKRDKEKNLKKREILDLKIEFLRQEVMASVNKSNYSSCKYPTPPPPTPASPPKR